MTFDEHNNIEKYAQTHEIKVKSEFDLIYTPEKRSRNS